MAKLKKRRFFRQVLIIFLIAAFFGLLFLFDCWRIKQGGFPCLKCRLLPYDYTFQSHQIDMAIESSLLRLGITNEDILKSYHEEKESGRKKWIYVYKELKVPLEAELNDYVRVIENELKKAGGKTIARQFFEDGENTARLTLGIKDILIATVVLKALPEAKIAIIIDDVGYGGSSTEKLLSLSFPVTLSILPFLPHSKDIAGEARRLGYEIMLHLPMESIRGEENRGEGIIYAGMKKKVIIDLIKRALASVPYAAGVNNHMGSRVCQDEGTLEVILSRIKKNNLYFIDSLVIANSQAYKIAQKMAIPSNYRRIFLDNQNHPDYIKAQLKKLKESAVAEGEAIGIGHCRKNTLNVLTEIVPEMKKEGIEFVFASELVK